MSVRSVFAGLLLVVPSAVWAQEASLPSTLPEKKIKTKTMETVPDQKAGVTPAGDSLKFVVPDDFKASPKDQTIQFKYGDSNIVDSSTSDDVEAEGSSFKAYPGYPKHRVGFDFLPKQVSSKWSYGGQDYNFKSNSNTAFGVHYKFQMTPMTNFGFEYSRYDVSVQGQDVTPYTIVDSKVAVDNYAVKSEFCSIFQTNFFQQWCFGADLGVESYPLLDFTGSTDLELSKVDDVILGVNVGYNHPLFTGAILRLKLGYNMGTGAGSSGELTSKSNSSLLFRGDVEWMWKEKHGFGIGAEYVSRNAKVEGLRGNNTDEWESAITTMAFRGSYFFEF